MAATKFRLQALARLGEPEELDVLPRLVAPGAWVAVLVLLLALSGAVGWSVLARLPRTVTAQGVLTPSSGLRVVQSPYAGVVVGLLVRQGQSVEVGQPIATVLTVDRTTQSVTSPFAGQVTVLPVSTGQSITAGATIMTLADPSAGSNLVAELFVPTSRAGQIAPGMSVLMSAESAPSAAFGLLRGRVASVDEYTLSTDQAEALLGNEILVTKLTAAGPQRLVTVELTADPATPSGYGWTSHNGPPFRLPPQSLLSGTVAISFDHPISFVFGH